MPSHLEALRALPTLLQSTSNAGIAGTYKRSATEISTTVIPGKTEFAPDPDAQLDRVKSRDFLVLVADIAALGVPAAGDQVLADLTGVGSNQTHTVGAPPGEPVYVYADEPFRLWYRVRVQE